MQISIFQASWFDTSNLHILNTESIINSLAVYYALQYFFSISIVFQNTPFLVRASAWLNTWSCASVRLFQLAYCLNDQAHIAWFTSGIPRGQLWDRRRPPMEDDIWWKMTFEGRRPLLEDDQCWKTTSDGRHPLMEDNLWWKKTFDGRQPLMEDDLWWKTTNDGRLPLKMTFNGRWPSIKDNLGLCHLLFGRVALVGLAWFDGFVFFSLVW